MNTTALYLSALENELEEIWIAVEIAYDEHGIRCEDGHWMTDEEFSQLSDREVISLFNLIYDKSLSLEELEAQYCASLCRQFARQRFYFALKVIKTARIKPIFDFFIKICYNIYRKQEKKEVKRDAKYSAKPKDGNCPSRSPK